MPFNGTGVFQRVRNWVADAAAGIKIRADYHDAEDDGFATGLTNCITKDGQTIVTQNIPFNSKRITGLADPVNAQDAATKAYADTKLPKDGGGKLTGDLEIEKDGPQLILDDTDASHMAIRGQRNGKDRWVMRLGNGEVETGANAGSNFDLLRYDDAGTLIGTPLKISRASGAMTVDTLKSVGGYLFLQDDNHYLHWSTGNFYWLPNSKLLLGAQGVSGNDAVTWDQLNTKQPNLGFTPVQQGGGATQGTNKIYIGWGTGGLRAQVDATDLGNFIFSSTPPMFNARLAYAGDQAIVLGPVGMYEPWQGAMVTGFEWTNVGYPIITYMRWRYMQIYTNAWYTVGYA